MRRKIFYAALSCCLCSTIHVAWHYGYFKTVYHFNSTTCWDGEHCNIQMTAYYRGQVVASKSLTNVAVTQESLVRTFMENEKADQREPEDVSWR